MPLLLLLSQPATPEFAFVDPTGNPFPAGIEVRFFNGPKVYPAPIASPNLLPNSDALSGLTRVGFTLGAGGPSSATDLEYVGTGSAIGSDLHWKSAAQVVTAGQTYSVDWWIDPSKISQGVIDFRIIDATTSAVLHDVSGAVTAGAGAARYRVDTFTIPTGTTSVFVDVLCASSQSGGFIVQSGQTLKFSQPQFGLSTYDSQTYLPSGVTLGEQVLSGYTQIGGLFSPNNDLFSGRPYTIAFFGAQAPVATVSFVYDSTQATQTLDPDYGSPVASQTGYANWQTQLWPRGWFNDAARSTGGIAYNLAIGLAAELLDLSQQQQAVILAARIDTSSGSDIESWVQDFFGLNLPRNAGEGDAKYIARAKSLIRAKRSTKPGVLIVAGYYGAASVVEPFRADQMGALGLATLALGSPTGAIGSMVPAPSVFIAPAAPLSTAQKAQAKSQVMASRPLGMNLGVFEVDGSTANKL